jgi:hypothetical protein
MADARTYEVGAIFIIVCYYGNYWLLRLFLVITEYYCSRGYFYTVVIMVSIVTLVVVVTVLIVTTAYYSY